MNTRPKGTAVSLLDRIADRIHAKHDAAARAQGLTVTRLPDGHRRIGHPALPALLEARRSHAITGGLDLADRLLLDGPTLDALNATHEQTTTSDRLRRAA